MADNKRVTRGSRRRNNTQSKSESEEVPEVMEALTESQPEEVSGATQEDVLVQEEMNEVISAVQETLEGEPGDGSSQCDKAEPVDVTPQDDAPSSSQDDLPDSSEKSAAYSEDANSSNQHEETTDFGDKPWLEKLFDPKWAELIRQLPEYCDPGLELEENDHKEGNTKLTYQVPMMPIADCVKRQWDEVNQELLEQSTQISPFRKMDDKRYWISNTDFKKYCQSSTVDREYCIQVEKEVMQSGAGFGGPSKGRYRRPFIKKSSAIQNPLLQTCENGFKKCDESARMAIRASSHAAFMLNALGNILKTSPSEQQTDALRMIEGIQGALESIADSSARVIARATVSRRTVCMSQIQHHESESVEKFIALPMDSKNLFHGEFYPTMQEHKKANSMKRKLPPPPLDKSNKRPSLMDTELGRQRSGFDNRDRYGGRFGPPPDQYVSYPPMGGRYNDEYNTFSSGRGRFPPKGGQRQFSRGNKRPQKW